MHDDGVWLIFNLIGGVVCGFITLAIASSKGRNLVGWFFVGFFAGLIGIIIAACMSNLTQESERRRMVELEQHRLREQLRQERLKMEVYRRYSSARLDMHDQALGMDTRPADALPGMEVPQAALPPGSPVALSQAPSPEQALARMVGAAPGSVGGSLGDGRSWYFESSGKVMGPVPTDQIRLLIRSGQVQGGTLLWTAGMSQWAEASTLMSMFGESAI